MRADIFQKILNNFSLCQNDKDDDVEDTSLHFSNMGMLGGFANILQHEVPSAIELAVRPDWSETKRRHLGESSRYDPPSAQKS